MMTITLIYFFIIENKTINCNRVKISRFKHEHKSQLELYLRWLDKYERQEDENSPLGILLCAEKSDEMIELLELDKAGIHVASYITELPTVDWLRSKLHKSIEGAQKRLNNKIDLQ